MHMYRIVVHKILNDVYDDVFTFLENQQRKHHTIRVSLAAP